MNTVSNSQASGPAAAEPSGPLIRLPGALARVGLGRSAWLDLVRLKRAPQPIKIGRATLWLAEEVDAWVRERVRASRSVGAR